MKRALPALFLALALAASLVWTKRQAFLVHAAVRGDVAILNALLGLGADPNSTATGSSPLYTAVWYHRLQVAAALLARGANVNAIEPSGVTPLIAAAASGDDAIVRLLLAHGASRHVKGPCGTPLDVARSNHHPSTVTLLLSTPSRPAP
jgi:ankyrin repeat protein